MFAIQAAQVSAFASISAHDFSSSVHYDRAYLDWLGAEVRMRNRLHLEASPRPHDNAVDVTTLRIAALQHDAVERSPLQSAQPLRRQAVLAGLRASLDLVEVFALQVEVQVRHVFRLLS